MGSRVGDPEHCQSATRLQQGAPPCRPGSCPLRCWQHSARTEVEHQHASEAIMASPHKDTGRMPLQLTRQQQLLRESMRRERPARSARTALRPLALPQRGRKRRGISGSRDPEMNAEAEGGKLSSQIKTDEYTAWTCLPKILHDQLQQIAHVSVTSSLSAAACFSLRPCDPPARTPTPRRIRLS